MRAVGRLLPFALGLTACAAAAAAAQTPQTGATGLSLEDAIARGLANSQRIAELDARIAAADFAIEGRKAADRPAVTLLGGYMRTNHVDEFAIALPGRPPQVVYPDIPDNYRARIDLQWPVYTGGRSDALERAVRAERGAAGEDLAAARADLRLEITRAYWAVVTARETEAVVSRSLEAINRQVEDLRNRLANGLIPPNDVQSAAAQASRQRMLSIEAQNARAIAEADLRRLIGVDSSFLLAPSAPLAPAPAAPRSFAPSLTPSRPERRALEQRAASAEARAAAVASTARPQVAFAAGYDYARPNQRIFPRRDEWHPSWDLGINVSWSLWDGGRRAADLGEAAANARAIRARIQEFDRQLAFDLEARSRELDSSRAAVSATDDEAAAAAEAERVVGERYRVGVATSTDVLEAQVARLQAELDRTRALANVRLAEARLRRAVGE